MKSDLKPKKQISAISDSLIAGRQENGITLVPQHMGSGYIKGFVLNSRLRLIVRQYELKEDWLLDRGIGKEEQAFIMITFHDIYASKDDLKKGLLQSSSGKQILPSVQVATTGFNYELLPANKKISSIVITVHTDYLKELLQPKLENTLLQMIISGSQPFLFEEIISPRIHEVAAEIVMANPANELQDFYYKVKAEELIYLLFAALLNRQDNTIQRLNAADIKRVYEVKNKILSNIEMPPAVTELVRFSGLSESKLKRIFRQVFGTSIYNYYQSFRMKEAAYLIKEEKLSVSEAGYRLGFSNLSHFSRLFEAHIGMKPKKYAGQG